MHDGSGDWMFLRLPGPRPFRPEGAPPWERVRAVTWWCAEEACPEAPDEGSDWCHAHRCLCVFCGIVIEDGEDLCLAHDPTMEDGYAEDALA